MGVGVNPNHRGQPGATQRLYLYYFCMQFSFQSIFSHGFMFAFLNILSNRATLKFAITTFNISHPLVSAQTSVFSDHRCMLQTVGGLAICHIIPLLTNTCVVSNPLLLLALALMNASVLLSKFYFLQSDIWR